MPYFTTAELRALPDLPAAKYSDADLDSARDWIESLIEQFCGTSFIARTVVDTLSGNWNYSLSLTQPYVQSITTVVENGTTLSGYTYTFTGGTLRRFSAGATVPSPWSWGVDNVVVTYQAGYSSTPPTDIKHAALKAARYHLMTFFGTAGQSDRQTSVSTELGTTSFAIATEDNPTGLPEVDATLRRHRSNRNNFGFA